MSRQESSDKDDSNSFSSDDDILYSEKNENYPHRRKPIRRSLNPDICESKKKDKKAKYKGVPSTDAENQREESLHIHGGPPAFISIGSVLFLLVILFLLGQYFTHRKTSNPPKEHKSAEMILKDIQQGIRYLREDLTQTREFWVQVFSQIEQMTQENPSRPAIILAIVPPDSRKTAACLSQKILELVSDAFNDRKYIAFDTNSHLSIDEVSFKHVMGDNMAKLNESHCAAVYNVENLPKEGIMLLHGLCDNENAPYKRALIWLTVELSLDYSSLASLRTDETIESYLLESWSDRMREEDSTAILSRIANAPVLIKPENSQSISKRCPI